LAETCFRTVLSAIFFYLAILSDKWSAAYLTNTINRVIGRMIRPFPPVNLAFHIAKDLISISNRGNISREFFPTMMADIFLRRILTSKRIFKSIFITAIYRAKFVSASFRVFRTKYFSAFYTRNFSMLRSTLAGAKIKTMFIDSTFSLKRLFTIITNPMKAQSLFSGAGTAPGCAVNYGFVTIYASIIKSSISVAIHRL